MTVQQPRDDKLAFPDLKPGIAWGDSITKKRAAELEAMLHRWETEQEHGNRRGPFDNVPLKGADVFWLAARTSAGANELHAVATAAQRILDSVLPIGFDASVRLNMLHIEGAQLNNAQLRGAILNHAHMEGASLYSAHLEDSTLNETHLEDSTLSEAQLDGAYLGGAWLRRSILHKVHLQRATLIDAHAEGAVIYDAHLEGATLDRAHLEGSFLFSTHMEGASLTEAHLEGANLIATHLESASLTGAHLEGKSMPAEEVARIHQWEWAEDRPGVVPPADMRRAYFDRGTVLDNVTLGTAEFGAVRLADVRWGEANLAVVGWTHTAHGFFRLRKRTEAIKLGDEREAGNSKMHDGFFEVKPKDEVGWLNGYRDAVRANRQLATVLRSQGLNEDADRFSYKAQTLQQEVLRRQGNIGGYAFSLLLWALSGYGYRLWRIAVAYGVVLLTFAVIFLALGVHSHPGEPGIQALWDSLLVSLSAIHGRTMFEQLGAWTLAAWFAAVESVVGIVIEGVFVAMLIQRFFAH